MNLRKMKNNKGITLIALVILMNEIDEYLTGNIVQDI